MKLGFLSTCLIEWGPEQLAQFAEKEAFDTLQLNAGRRSRHIDWEAVARGEAEELSATLASHGVACSSLLCAGLPFLDPDPEQRAQAASHLGTVLRAAHSLGVPVVSTLPGSRIGARWAENVAAFKEVFTPLAEMAEGLDVKIAFENCPMTRGSTPVRSIAYAPAVWDAMFDAVPSPVLGLEFDPSHLFWLGVDPLPLLREYSSRIWHVHAKDTEVFPERRQRESILGESWWRFCLPGYGSIDWGRFIGTLCDVGYEGAVTIEHEDRAWLGSDERVTAGLRYTRDYLRRWL